MKERLVETCAQLTVLQADWHKDWNEFALGKVAHGEIRTKHVLCQTVAMHLSRAWLSLDTALQALESYELDEEEQDRDRRELAGVPPLLAGDRFDVSDGCTVFVNVDCGPEKGVGTQSCCTQDPGRTEAPVRDWNRTLTGDDCSTSRQDEQKAGVAEGAESVEVSVPVDELG